MKIILSTLSLLFVFNFVYSQDSTQKETRYKKGSLLISNNFILGGIATTGDTIPNQLILNYGLKPVLQYFFIPNWSFGVGLAYRRTVYQLNNFSYSPGNHFDLVLSTSYYLRTHKKLSHFFELMYMGGKQAFLTNQSKHKYDSSQPFTNKLRYTYGVTFKAKNWGHIELGGKYFWQQYLGSKTNEIANYKSMNLFVNYHF
jgi:hypothetical protein